MTDETTGTEQVETDQPVEVTAAARSREDDGVQPVEEESAEVAMTGVGAAIPEGFSAAVFAELSASHPEETDALRKSWGSDAPLNTAFARRALEQIEVASPGLVAELSRDIDVASPKTLAALAALGRSLAATPGDPDTVRLDRAMAEAINAPTTAAAPQTPETPDLQGEIDRITAEAWDNGTYYSTAVQETLGPLYERLHGTAETAGRQA